MAATAIFTNPLLLNAFAGKGKTATDVGELVKNFDFSKVRNGVHLSSI